MPVDLTNPVLHIAYLRKHGTPTEAAQLQAHQCLVFSGMDQPNIWRFSGPQGKVSTHIHGRLKLSSMDALYDAVLADLGIALMPSWFWTKELRDGRVCRLLPNYSFPSQDIHAVTASRHRAGGKIKRFVSFVQSLLENDIEPNIGSFFQEHS